MELSFQWEQKDNTNKWWEYVLCQMEENAVERNKTGPEVGGFKKGVPVLNRVVKKALWEDGIKAKA